MTTASRTSRRTPPLSSIRTSALSPMVEKKARSSVLCGVMSNEIRTSPRSRSTVITTAGDQAAHHRIGNAVAVQEGYSRDDQPADQQDDDRDDQCQDDVYIELHRVPLGSSGCAALSARNRRLQRLLLEHAQAQLRPQPVDLGDVELAEKVAGSRG